MVCFKSVVWMKYNAHLNIETQTESFNQFAFQYRTNTFYPI